METWQQRALKTINEKNVENGYPAIQREELTAWNQFVTHFDSDKNDVIETGKKDRVWEGDFFNDWKALYMESAVYQTRISLYIGVNM